MITFTFVRLTAVVTHHTLDIPKNLAALSTYLGARQMSKREFFAAFFAFLAAILNGVVIYTYFLSHRRHSIRCNRHHQYFGAG